MRLDDKVTLITGAGSGIGRAIALRFAAEGARVVVNDRTITIAEQTTKKLKGAKALAVGADVTDSAAVKAMFAEVKRTFGRLDILVNNAGIANSGAEEIRRFNVDAERRIEELMSGKGIQTHWTTTRDLPDDAWRKMLDTHVTGSFFCAREAIRMMEGRKGCSIINMSSIAGLAGLEAIPAYCAAKAALLGFTRSLALELGSLGIRVNAICPGFIETPMTSPMSPMLKATLAARTPLGRWGKPDEIADAALFLASEESSIVTGQWISPNGGIVMQ
jgi:3-oxoacyl-[acyl-carrier protein] reductase